MTTQFPTGLDSYTNPSANNPRNSPSLAGEITDKNDAIVAIEAKLGINGSGTATTFDYKLSGVLTGDIAASVGGTQTLTHKTLTSPIINGATIATSTIPESNLTFTDITTGDASTSKHGFLKKLPGGTLTYLRGDGTFSTIPTGTGVTVTSVTGTTLSLTTTAGQVVVVWAKGDIYNNAAMNATVSLKYNGTTKDTVVAAVNTGDPHIPFSLMYTEIPGAATNNITVEKSEGTFENVVIIAQILG